MILRAMAGSSAGNRREVVNENEIRMGSVLGATKRHIVGDDYCAEYMVRFGEKIVGATEWRSFYQRVRSVAVRKDEIERNYIGRESDKVRSFENFVAES